MDETTLTQAVLEAARAAFAPGAPGVVGAMATGFHSATGRELPLIAERVSVDAGVVILSDAGEAWWALVSDGYADGRPVADDRRRVERLAKLYDVTWNQRACAFQAAATIETAPSVGRRILSASLALDGWRALVTPSVSRAAPVTSVIAEAARLAVVEGFAADRKHRVHGRSQRDWRPELWLSRGADGVAVMSFSERWRTVLDRSLAWYLDTGSPAVVMAPEDVVPFVTKALELHGHVEFVPRRLNDPTRTARDLIAGAKHLLSPKAA